MKPREVEVALETEAYNKWRTSASASRETCPLNITAYEKVRMIEYSAYETAIRERDEARAEANEVREYWNKKSMDDDARAAILVEALEAIAKDPEICSTELEAEMTAAAQRALSQYSKGESGK